MNHSSCSHPATSSARAKCRRAGEPSPAPAPVPVAPVPVAVKPARRRSKSDIVVPHTNAVKPDGLTDDEWELILRNRARFTRTPYPTVEERIVAFERRSSGIPNVPPAEPYMAPKPAPVVEIAERKTAAAVEAASQLPTYTNAARIAEPIPAGRYAITNANGDYEFYKIDKPTEGKWAGKVFLKIIASSTEYPIKQAARQMTVFQAIVDATPQAAMATYGLQLGHCGHCNRPLTDPESIARGIGPVCAARNGW